jgi:AcrR family transcriptional regulator
MDKREQIYEKALELFIANGYDQTPLSQIAHELNLTKAGLYHYFQSKEELLFFLHQHNMEVNFIPVLDAAEKIADPEKRIAYFLKHYTESSLTKSAAAKVLIHEINRLQPEHQKIIKKTWRRAFNLLRNAISELESIGKSKGINKTFAAFAAIGMCSWTFYWFDYNRGESGGELSDTYAKIFLNGLLARRSGKN